MAGGASSRSALPGKTEISAYGSNDSEVLEVIGGRTTALPFGPPYKLIAEVSPTTAQPGQQVRLGMSMVGSAGERVGSLLLDGKKPEEPQFTISTADGEKVDSGNFEWG